MDKEYIKQLISDYREAEETEDYDKFQEKYGDIDELCDTLMDFIEKEIL